MKNITRIYCLTILVIIIAPVGCGDGVASVPTGGTDTQESSTDSNDATETTDDTDTDTPTETAGDTVSDTDTETASESTGDTRAVRDTDTDDTDSDSESPGDSDTETESDEDAGTDLGTDTGSGQVFLVDRLEIAISGSPAAADNTDEVEIAVTALDAEGLLVPEADLLELYVLRGFEPEPLVFEAPEDGSFSAIFATFGAGDYAIVAEDMEGHVASATATFLPGAPSAIDIVSLSPASVEASGDRNLRTIATIALRDENGNPVSVTPETIEVVSDVGTVGAVSQDPDQLYYHVEITSSDFDFGTLSVTYSEEIMTPLQADAPLYFPPATLRTGSVEGGLPGIEEEGTIDVYFQLNAPGSIEPIYLFDAWIYLDPTILQFNLATEHGDDCTLDYAIWYGYDLNFGGTCPDFTGSTLPLKLEFEPLSVDFESSLAMVEIQYADENRDLITPSDLGSVWSPYLEYSLMTKDEIVLPVHIWVQPDHATNAEIQDDVDLANEILALNAKRCACAHFYIIDPLVTHLSATEWRNLSGVNQALDAPERQDVHRANDGDTYDNDTYNLYYGELQPDVGVFGAFDSTSQAAFVDNTGDSDNRTLAHVFGHLVAEGLLDSPDDTDAQGARAPGNLYNLTDMGDHLTAEQCALFPQ